MEESDDFPLDELTVESTASANELVDTSVNYRAMEMQRTAMLQAEMEVKLRSEATVRGQSIQRLVLQSVVIEDYERAKEDVENYVIYKSNYPQYPKRVQRHAKHCRELIDAIRVKRNFPGLSGLSMAKQREILDHVLNHFEDLKTTLKLMEKIAKDVTLSDMRSTTWFLRVSSYMVMLVVITSFVINFEKEVGSPIWIHFNVMTDELFHTLWKMIMGSI